MSTFERLAEANKASESARLVYFELIQDIGREVLDERRESGETKVTPYLLVLAEKAEIARESWHACVGNVSAALSAYEAEQAVRS